MAGGREPKELRPGRIPGCECSCAEGRYHHADCLWYPQVVGSEEPHHEGQRRALCST